MNQDLNKIVFTAVNLQKLTLTKTTQLRIFIVYLIFSQCFGSDFVKSINF